MHLALPINYLLILLCCVSISACGKGDSAEAMLADYLKRLERATGIKSKPTSQAVLITYPSPREQNLQTVDLRMGVLDFAKLYQCDLFNLISERNSIMGRVMPISQQLVYETTFLQSAHVCYQKLAAAEIANEEFLALFAEAIRTKRANLPVIFWHATFNSPELKKAFSLAVSPLDPDENELFVNARQTVAYFHGLGKQLNKASVDIDKDELETHYYNLQRHQYAGRLFKSVARLAQYLNRAAYSLETVVAESPLCIQNKLNEKARILNNVFRKYYGQRVGAYTSQINQQGKAWLADIDALVQVQDVELPTAFTRYKTQMLTPNAGLWQHFDAAIKRHTKAWQTVLGPCGLMPVG